MTKARNRRPTPKQMALVDIMMTRENISITEAGVMAGFSKKNAAQTASRALALPHVRAYYDAQLAKRTRRTGIDADYVLQRLAAIETMDVAEIFDEHENLLPIQKWPLLWRQMVKEVDLKTGRVKLQDKLRTLELMGKHIGVRAFAELVEITDTTGIAERMNKARKRAGKTAE